MKIHVEWKVEDLWIGAFWKRSGNVLHLWICVLPCIPIHMQFSCHISKYPLKVCLD